MGGPYGPLFEFFKNMHFCTRDGLPTIFVILKSPEFDLFFQKFAQSAVPFFFGWPLVLDMAEGHVPRCRKGVSF